MNLNKFNNIIDKLSYIGLEKPYDEANFATPLNANIFAAYNGIHYCTVKDYDEIIFVVNTEGNTLVYPVAHNLDEFINLVFTLKNANVLNQIIDMNEETFINFVNSEEEQTYYNSQEVIKTLNFLKENGAKFIDNPFKLVKDLQNNFDYSKLKFSQEYYEILGIVDNENGFDFEDVTFIIKNER